MDALTILFLVVSIVILLVGIWAAVQLPKMLKQKEAEGEIHSPDGAAMHVEQTLNDKADPSGIVALTCHKIASSSVVNIWLRHNGKWRRIRMEKTFPSEPHKSMLELMFIECLLSDVFTREKLQLDLNYEFVTSGLGLAIKRL